MKKIGPLAVFAIWSLYGLLLFTQVQLNRPADLPAPWKPWGSFVFFMSSAWVWAAATPLIALLVRRARPSAERLHLIGVHIAAIAAIHAVATVVDAATFYFVAKRFSLDFLAAYQRGFVGSILFYSATALAVLALDHARLARERALHAARLESDLTRARLDTLRRQIQPHFLFNTLNTIAELIDTDPARAGEMVARLGELLRRSLDEHEQSMIPLRAELEFVRLYTEIERVRFESWLSVREEIEPAALDAWVPPMLLQPLVENAIKHGIAPSSRQGTIVLRAQVDGRILRLEVEDDGVGMRKNGNGRTGIGLAATRERLAHLFGANAALTLSAAPQAGTRVTLDVPLTYQPESPARLASAK